LNTHNEHLLIHTDGAARGNPGPAGAAALLYDESGACVGEILQFLGNTTNNVAEYRGLLLGLNRAREMGARSVEVVTDSELLAKQWSGEYRVKNEGLKPLYREAMEISSAFESVTLRHVRRGGNAAADEAANRAIDEKAGI
jgi:ribonuclease HI